MNKEINQYLSDVKQNLNQKKVLAFLLLLIFAFHLYNSCQREKTPAIVEVTIPTTTGKFEAVKPKQEAISKSNVKKNPIYINLSDKEREFFQYQLDSLLSLTTAYEQEFIYSDSVKKNNIYKDAIQLKYFSHPFENDTIKVELSGLVRGTVESVNIDKWTYKEHKATVTVNIPKPKETFIKMNAGANIGINKELKQLAYGFNISFEGKKGNAILLNNLKIKEQNYFSVGYSRKIFDWKRESKK